MDDTSGRSQEPSARGTDRTTAFYRTSAAGNAKPRPHWFSRRVALRSFLLAADRIGAEVVVVADGGLPAELRDLVPGEVVEVRGGSAAKGFRRLLDVADVGTGLVWFAEDDHLYRPEALAAVHEALQALPHADYASVYTPDNSAWHARSPSQPAHRGPQQRWQVGDRVWQRTWDSVSSFGLRAEALRQDRALLRLCSRCGGPWDHACVLAVQGQQPYPWRALHTDLFLRWSRASAGRVVTRPALRAAVDLAAVRRARTWVAPVVDLATHAEIGHIAPGTDWAALADACR